MQITFPLDINAMQRPRFLELVKGTKTYAVPHTPLYQQVHDFFEAHKQGGYPFNMLTLLHVAGVKMLEGRLTPTRNVALFAAGGLFLSLDQAHSDLAIHNVFDDFTSGFSHQFGVALAVMAMSEAYGIDWDKMESIKITNKGQTLDYDAQIPATNNRLHLEAKGVTSEDGRKQARRSAHCKMVDNPKRVRSPKKILPIPTAMVGVITQASRNSNQGILEVIDPDFKISAETSQRENQLARHYWHYAGVARFAGLNNVADEFMDRATNLINTGRSNPNLQQIDFQQKAEFERQGSELVGLQWRLSETADPAGGIWFYHGVEKERIRRIIEDDNFPECPPFSTRFLLNTDVLPKTADAVAQSDEGSDSLRRQIAENMLPDGSSFGIGFGKIDGLLEVDAQQTDLDKLKLATLS